MLQVSCNTWNRIDTDPQATEGQSHNHPSVLCDKFVSNVKNCGISLLEEHCLVLHKRGLASEQTLTSRQRDLLGSPHLRSRACRKLPPTTTESSRVTTACGQDPGMSIVSPGPSSASSAPSTSCPKNLPACPGKTNL